MVNREFLAPVRRTWTTSRGLCLPSHAGPIRNRTGLSGPPSAPGLIFGPNPKSAPFFKRSRCTVWAGLLMSAVQVNFPLVRTGDSASDYFLPPSTKSLATTLGRIACAPGRQEGLDHGCVDCFRSDSVSYSANLRLHRHHHLDGDHACRILQHQPRAQQAARHLHQRDDVIGAHATCFRFSLPPPLQHACCEGGRFQRCVHVVPICGHRPSAFAHYPRVGRSTSIATPVASRTLRRRRFCARVSVYCTVIMGGHHDKAPASRFHLPRL